MNGVISQRDSSAVLHRSAQRLRAAMAWLAVASSAAGQEERLIDRQPFDTIVLDQANENRQLQVQPLPFPERRIPQGKKPNDRLPIVMASQDEKRFQVKWGAIREIRLFEDEVLREAQELVRQKRFDEAYDYFAYLLDRFPNTAGLTAAREDYLYLNGAEVLQQQKQYQRALAIYEELYRLNPNYRYQDSSLTLPEILDRAADQAIATFFTSGDYDSAKALLQRLLRSYGDRQLAAVARWQQRFVSAAEEKLREARRLVEAGSMREARDVGREMLRIWPTVAGGRELIRELARRYPIVSVAVDEASVEPEPVALDSPAARRLGRLLHRTLVEFQGPGPEGGRYACPIGTTTLSDDRRSLLFQGAQPDAGGGVIAVSRLLLNLADPARPGFRPDWARLLSNTEIVAADRLRVNLQRPHVVPEGYLQVRLDPQLPARQGRYRVATESADEVRYVADRSYPWPLRTGEPLPPQEIVERRFAGTRVALESLRRGDVDAIARLFPAEAAATLQDTTLVTRRYRVPSVHLLLPNYRRPFLAQVAFRKAICFAINREGILRDVLLLGRELPGCRVLSGPFTDGIAVDDPLDYAADPRLAPRPYNPQLAVIMAELSRRELAEAAKKQDQQAPQLQPLKLGHPSREIARAACEAISFQLSAVGINCQLLEFPPGICRDVENQCDLVYAELDMAEPVVDARRLLGDQGLAAVQDAYVDLALRRLDEAHTWTEVRQRLQQLHAVVFDRMSVIPLWQLVDYAACQKNLQLPAEDLVSLYQGIEQWQLEPAAD